MAARWYRGWTITQHGNGPRFRAAWHGVTMNANDRASLLRMIDQRAEDKRERRQIKGIF